MKKDWNKSPSSLHYAGQKIWTNIVFILANKFDFWASFVLVVWRRESWNFSHCTPTCKRKEWDERWAIIFLKCDKVMSCEGSAILWYWLGNSIQKLWSSCYRKYFGTVPKYDANRSIELTVNQLVSNFGTIKTFVTLQNWGHDISHRKY